MPPTARTITGPHRRGRATKHQYGAVAANPAFAPQTFTSWFRQRGVRNTDKPQVLLWSDTFNNYFHPATAQAAVAVLEAAGYQVVIPSQSLCCGRPLYDYGMLDLAQHQLRRICLLFSRRSLLVCP